MKVKKAGCILINKETKEIIWTPIINWYINL